jgi:hypothetical protein
LNRMLTAVKGADGLVSAVATGLDL